MPCSCSDRLPGALCLRPEQKLAFARYTGGTASRGLSGAARHTTRRSRRLFFLLPLTSSHHRISSRMPPRRSSRKPKSKDTVDEAAAPAMSLADEGDAGQVTTQSSSSLATSGRASSTQTKQKSADTSDPGARPLGTALHVARSR